MFHALRLWFRLQWWSLRRRWLCTRGNHVWHTFGRSRVCRCCHREEWLEGSSHAWKHEAHRPFAESRPSWHRTQPGLLPPSHGEDEPTNGN